MHKLTKGVLQQHIQKKYHTSVKSSHIVVDAFFDSIIKLSKEDGGVILQNLGRFEFQKKTLEKNIYNFNTKTSEVKSIHSERIHFKSSKNLKEKVF